MISAKSFATNFSIQLVGKFLSVAIGLVTLGVLTRHLSAAGFGEYTTTMTFLQMFGVVVDFGLTLTLVVMISESGADEEQVVGNFFTLRILSGILLFGIAPLAVLFSPWSTHIKQAVAVGAIAYLLMGAATMLVGVFQRYESMWRVAIAELLNRAVLLGTVLWFASLQLGVVAMVAAGILANAIWLLGMLYLARPFVRVRPRIDAHIWKRALTLSWPIALSIIFNLLYLKGDILFLALFRDQVEVGIYGVSYRVLDVLTALPVMFMGLLLPSLVRAISENNLSLFRSRMNRTFDLFMIAVIPAIVGVQIVAEDLTALIAGDEYRISGAVLSLLIFAVIGVFLGALYGHAIIAVNKQREMIWGYAAVAVVSLAGYLWLIPLYGMWGAVWVTLVSEALIAIVTFAVIYHTTKTLPSLNATLKALVAASVMYVLLMLFPTPHVLLDVSLGAIYYTLCLFLLKGITSSDLRLLLKSA